MKKIVLGIFFIAVCSAAAYAQIEVAGQNFSMMVVVPIVLMAVFMLIFGIVIAFDRHREKKEEEAAEKKESDNSAPLLREKEKGSENKDAGQKKTAENKEKGHKILAEYLDEIKELKKKSKKMGPDDAFNRLVALIRNFFSDYLGIGYEFTFDELEKELKEKNKEVVFFSKNLSDMCYNAESISKQDVAGLFDDFEDVAKKIALKEEIAAESHGIEKGISEKISETQENLSRPFASSYNFFSRLQGKGAELKEEKEKEETKKSEYIDEEKKRKIIELIREGRAYLKRDINRANDIYEEVYVIYHQLPESRKKELQQKVVDFYNAIRIELKS